MYGQQLCKKLQGFPLQHSKHVKRRAEFAHAVHIDGFSVSMARIARNATHRHNPSKRSRRCKCRRPQVHADGRPKTSLRLKQQYWTRQRRPRPPHARSRQEPSGRMPTTLSGRCALDSQRRQMRRQAKHFGRVRLWSWLLSACSACAACRCRSHRSTRSCSPYATHIQIAGRGPPSLLGSCFCSQRTSCGLPHRCWTIG